MPANNFPNFASVWEQLNPSYPGLTATEKRLRLLVLFFAGLSFYRVLTDFSLLVNCVQNVAREPLACSFYLALFVVLPAATIALFQRKPLGWTLAVGYLAVSVGGALVGLWSSLTWVSSGAALDRLFPRSSPLPHLLRAAVATGGLVVLNQLAVRQVFAIGPRRLAAVVLVSVVLAGVATVFG